MAPSDAPSCDSNMSTARCKPRSNGWRSGVISLQGFNTPHVVTVVTRNRSASLTTLRHTSRWERASASRWPHASLNSRLGHAGRQAIPVGWTLLTDSEPDFEKILWHAAGNVLSHDPPPLEDLAKLCDDAKTDLQTHAPRYGLAESDATNAEDTLDVAWCAFYELKLLAVVQQFRVACELFSKRSGGRRLKPTAWNLREEHH